MEEGVGLPVIFSANHHHLDDQDEEEEEEKVVVNGVGRWCWITWEPSFRVCSCNGGHIDIDIDIVGLNQNLQWFNVWPDHL